MDWMKSLGGKTGTVPRREAMWSRTIQVSGYRIVREGEPLLVIDIERAQRGLVVII
jgi:hypothetical protein